MIRKIKYLLSSFALKIILFIEDWFLKILTVAFLIFIALIYFKVFNPDSLILYFHNLIFNNLDTFSTMSSIFIGIYFTVLTLFMSFSTIDVMKSMKYSQVNKMINYIILGFIFSFLLLLISLFSNYDNNFILTVYSYILIMMLLNTMRFGLVLFLWVRKFVKEFPQKQLEIKRSESEMKELNQKLFVFLKTEEIKEINMKNKK